MWKNRLVYRAAVLLSLVLLLAACRGKKSLSGAAADPTPGHFEGTTSQGMSISLWVEKVNGRLMVTAIQYKIKMEAQGFSVTSELMMPSESRMMIEGGRFSGTDTEGDTTEEISGKFIGDEGVEGRLRCSHVHPQGLGTAVGDVTFVAYKVSP